MTRKTIIGLFCSLCLSLSAWAASSDDVTVSGIIVDDNQESVIGAAVISGRDLSNGALSDIDGRFSIRTTKGDTLTISALGYVDKTVIASENRSNLRIVLQSDVQVLDDVVVVGYGVQKKVNLTGAVSVVSSQDLENRTSPDLTHMLQGSVPGLFVSTSSGNPMDEASINIRGVNSLNGGSPLVLIDGVEGDISKVNPNDVESVSVIKDASSAAIYGARASFGVILVTTKSGKNTEGKPVVRYSGNFGFTSPTTCTDYETSGYWSVYVTDLFANGTYNTNYTHYTEEDMQELWARRNDKVEDPSRPWVVEEVRNGRNSYIYYANTDWYHELYTDINPMQQHNFSVSGGSGNMRYYLSGGYEHKQGTFKVRPDKYNKYNVRSKIDVDLNKFLTLSNNMSFYASDYDYPGNAAVDNTFRYGAVHGLASFPRTNPDGTWVYKTILLDSNVTNGCHIELGQDTKINLIKKYNFSNTTELTAHVFEGFDIKANFTWTRNEYKDSHRWTNSSYSTYPGEILWDKSGRFQNMLEETNNETRYTATNIYASYKHSFEQGHNISAVAGVNYEYEVYKNNYQTGRNLSSDYISDFNLVQPDETTGSKAFTITGGQGEYAIAGAFFRANYDYKEKYLLEVSGRLDGTSKFDREHRWGFFPSASAGWKFSEESWMQDASWLNMGKLRFSFGSLGNQQVGYYDFVRTINVSGLSYLFESDSQLATGSSVSAPNAGNLTWEVAKHYNAGLDIYAFDNRLSFSGEAYIRDTEGMLTRGDDLPGTYGAATPKKNGANLRSKGYELTLGWKDSFSLAGKPFSYGVTATLSDYISVITKYENPSRLLGTYYEGMVLGEIWGFRTDGLFASDEEAAAYTSTVDQSYVNYNLNGGWKGGDVKYLDLDGDGEISKGGVTVDNPGDMCIIGNSNPRYQYGITLTAAYLGFDLSVFFQGVGHRDWYPPTYCHSFWGPYNQCSQTFLQKNWMDNVWSEENTDAYFPRPRCDIGNVGGTEITTVNDRYLQNIGYCRLKNLTFGYTLPSSLMHKLPLENIRVYFTGENLAYVSPLQKINKYMDPEQAATDAYLGFLYPWQKSFIMGIDITF